MNKEKLLFGFSLILSILVLKHYASMAFVPLPSQRGFEKKTPRAVSYLCRDFFQKFPKHWKNSRNLFKKVSDKKSLTAVRLEPPLLKLPGNIALPPVPAPLPKYWTKFLSSRFAPLDTEFAEFADIEKISFANIEETELSPLAKKLKSKVRLHDIVQLKKNKQKFVGTIIEQNSEKVTINISDKKTYTWKRDQVTIKRAVSLQKLCSKRFQEVSRSPGELLKLSQACGELELNDLADEYFEHLLSLDPKLTSGYLAYANYCWKRLQIDKACRIYFRAISNGVDSEEIRMGLSGLQEKLGLKRQALRTLQPCSQIPYLCKKLELAYALQDQQTAKQLTGKLENITPESKYWDMACYWKARWAFLNGEIDRCIEYCEQAQKPAAYVYNLQGAALYLKGNLEKAATLLRAAAKNDARAWYNLALVYFAGGVPKAAIKILEITHSKAPVVLTPSRTLATLAYLTYASDPSEFKRAVEIIEVARRSDRENFLVYYLYGEILENTPVQALQKYSEALDLEYSFSCPLLKSATLALKEEQVEDAFYFAQELSDRREFITAQYTASLYELLARIYIEQGRKSPQCGAGGAAYLARKKALQAKERLEAAIDIAPDDKSALCMLAWLNNSLGNGDAAISCLDRVLEKNKHCQYALDAREKIIENRGRVFWEDFFNRPGGDAVRLGWLENEPQGTEILLEQNKVVIAGKGIVRYPATLSRKLKSGKFVSFSAKVDFLLTADARAGLFVAGYPNGPVLYLGKGLQGELKYSFKGQKDWKAVLHKGAPCPLDAAHVLGIHKEKQNYRFYLDDRLLEPEIVLNLDNYDRLEIGLFGFSEKDVNWEFSVDNVRIVERQ